MSLPSEDTHIMDKLNKLSKVYGLPLILNEKAVVIDSISNLETYQSLILPTHVLPKLNDHFDLNPGDNSNINDNVNNIENNNNDSNIIHNSKNNSGINISPENENDKDIYSDNDYNDNYKNSDDNYNHNDNNNNNNINHNNHNNHNNSNGSEDDDNFNEFDNNDKLNDNFDNNNNNNTTTTNNNQINTSTNSNTNSNSSKLKNSIVLIGHGISNNGGIPINNLSKIPSYQWGFKHEDDNQLLNSLTTNESSSISSLAGNMPNINSAGLNSRMVRLPIKTNFNNSNIDNYDLKNYLKINNSLIQGGMERSLMNGLPYYDIKMAENLIRKLNLEKKNGFKASNTNTSWFSDTLNETIDDIEYLHGEVILNQFVNNKRVIRNYDWYLYWNEKIGNKKLIDLIKSKNNNDIMTFKTYEKLMKFRNKKFRNLQKVRSLIRQDMVKLDTKKEEKRNEYREKFGSLPNNLDSLINGENSKIAIDIYGEDLLNQENELIKKENEIPEYEEELDTSLNDLKNDSEDENDTNDNNEKYKDININSSITSYRFGGNLEFNKEQEVVIEKEFQINDPELIKIQNKLYGSNKSLRLQNDAKSKSGIITSKVVKIKRSPNPNALGFSNIRSRKPSFM